MNGCWRDYGAFAVEAFHPAQPGGCCTIAEHRRDNVSEALQDARGAR